MPLIFGVSGLRGVVDKGLTPEIAQDYALLFAQFMKVKRIVIGRDTRGSGPVLKKAVIRGLKTAGCEIIDLGIVPTPTVLFMVRKIRAQAGLVITASHNPEKWNGLKFIDNKGNFLDEKQFNQFSKFIQKNIGIRHYKSIPGVVQKYSGVGFHIEGIVSNLGSVRKGIKVGIDAVGGAGAQALPNLLRTMGCQVYRLNCRYSRQFPRGPEPIPRNIKDLCQLVKLKKLDIGFAVDPDCDRLAVVDEDGHPIGEELSLVLATDYILSRRKGVVVTNLSTTARMEYITKKYGCPLYRTKVGEANVVAKMRRVNAIIGGEGNGGIIYPKINFTRDALTGAAIILKLISERDKKISTIVAEYPRYYMIKKKVKLDRQGFERKEKLLLRRFMGRVNRVDGIRISARDYWLHIRPSNTEPVIRIIGEAKMKSVIEDVILKIEMILNK